MHGPVFAPVAIASQALHILSGQHRLYVGLSRDGSYLHVIRPLGFEQTDQDGVVVRRAEELVCSCRGFTFHGHCYRATQAIAYEQGDAIEAAWFGDVVASPRMIGLDSPAGAGEMVEASRG